MRVCAHIVTSRRSIFAMLLLGGDPSSRMLSTMSREVVQIEQASSQDQLQRFACISSYVRSRDARKDVPLLFEHFADLLVAHVVIDNSKPDLLLYRHRIFVSSGRSFESLC